MMEHHFAKFHNHNDAYAFMDILMAYIRFYKPDSMDIAMEVVSDQDGDLTITVFYKV